MLDAAVLVPVVGAAPVATVEYSRVMIFFVALK